MVLLSKKKQLVSVVEDIEGTTPAGAFTTSANANVVINSVDVTYEIDGIQREFLRNTLSKLKDIPGQKTGNLSVAFELVGNVDNTYASGVPSWSKFFEMSGFRLTEIRCMRLKSGDLGVDAVWSATGPIRHGEYVLDDAGVNYARVVGDCHKGDNYIFYEPPRVVGTGALATAMIGSSTTEGTPGLGWSAQDTGIVFDTFTNGSNTVVAETTNAGWAWIPVSEPIKQATIASAAGTVSIGAVYFGEKSHGAFFITEAIAASGTTMKFRASGTPVTAGETLTKISGTGTATLTADATPAETFVQWPTGSFRVNEDGVYSDFSGARGSISFSFEVNRPLIATFTPRGRWDGSGDTPLISETSELIDPDLWGGVVTALTPNEGTGNELFYDEQKPCFKSLTLDVGVGLTDVKCSGETDGLREIIGSSRSGSGSMTISAPYEGQVPLLGALRSGEVQRMRINMGTNIVGLNAMSFLIPAAQSSSVASGDDSGELTRSVDFSLNAGVIDNLDPITANNLDGEVYSTRGDNELIVRYITSIS